MKIDYKNYFTNQFKNTYTKGAIEEYKQWFYAQWNVIKNYTKIDEQSRILELGSGMGGLYSLLQDEYGNIQYHGTELDAKAVQFSNTYFKTNCFEEIAIEDMNVKKHYTHIFAFEVLEHLMNPIEDIEKIYALLEPGGIFIGTSPYPYEKNIIADKTHLHVLHPTNWKRLFEIHGFKKVHTMPMSFFPFLWRIHRAINPVIPIYLPFPKFISTTLIIAHK